MRPRGNRGELLAESYSSRVDRFSRLQEVTLFPPGGRGEGRAAVVESAWWHQGRLVLKFSGVDTISQAEALRDHEVSIPASERAELPEGEYYRDDLVGCEVAERETGKVLGRVTGWQDSGGAPLLVVEGGGGELLIPFAASICVAIEAGRRIEVALPEGLKDLNAP